MTQQPIAWEWLDRPGLDVATLAHDAQGLRVQGRVVLGWEGAPLDLSYDVHCGPLWQFRQAHLSLAHGGERRDLRLSRADGDIGAWEVDGVPRPDLADARDIDIMGTPLTNTLPIQRLAWTPGQGRDFVMAYIRLPDLAVRPVRQRYTAEDLGDPQLRAFRYRMLPADAQGGAGSAEGYHSPETGFSARLLVDAGGLVLDYPPYWRRAGFSSATPSATAGSSAGRP